MIRKSGEPSHPTLTKRIEQGDDDDDDDDDMMMMMKMILIISNTMTENRFTPI